MFQTGSRSTGEEEEEEGEGEGEEEKVLGKEEAEDPEAGLV